MASTTTEWQAVWQEIKDDWGVEDDANQLLAIRTANKVLRNWRRKIDLESVIRLGSLSYVGDFKNYAIVSDMKAGGIISLRKQENSVILPIELITPKRFAEMTNGEFLARGVDKGVEYLQLLHDLNNDIKVALHNCDVATEWTAGVGVASLTTDTTNKKEGTASLIFNVSGTSATLTAALGTALDLSSLGERALVRLFCSFSSITNLTSVTLRWGSDSSNYYQRTITTQADGRPFNTQSLFNELELKKTDATVTGTPVDTAIDYLYVSFAFSASVSYSNFRLDNIVAYKPEVLDYEYYSIYTVKNANGDWQDGFTVATETAINEIPLLYDEWIPGFTAEILYYLLAPEEDSRRMEYLSIANQTLSEIKKNFSSRRMHYKRQWLLPSLSRI